MVNPEDIEPEIVIIENENPLELILNELKVLSNECGLGEVSFKVKSEGDNFINLFQIIIPKDIEDIKEFDCSFYIYEKIYDFCRDNDILLSLLSSEILFVRR
ncbi:hypothetical protein BGI41_01680 [Methanobrevibacter sp. 87.7]|uniref:hypothetical protein n=1 Tax=Methanobrevibacter sp. 87.7 TaxID=387957 RepID=UPI000B504C48|nr:hypothetical protein [Methanobrevibacter sp. 87.7]OWT33592.1 hypothetical protein BGI41_01680 [Methanobrevibacter sp. 87.7]